MSTESDAGRAAAFLAKARTTLRREVLPAVEEALLELPEQQAFALEQSLFGGEEDSAIASMMNVSEEKVRSLRQEAWSQLRETRLGQQLGPDDMRDTLELVGKYRRRRRGRGTENFREALEESFDAAGEPSLPERLPQTLSHLWKRVIDEVDAAAEQVVGGMIAEIQGMAEIVAGPEEAERRRIELPFSVETSEGIPLRGLLVREIGGWRIVVEAHGERLEGVQVHYEIVTGTGRVLHEDVLTLSEFEEGVYEGSEIVGRLDVDPDVEPKVYVIALSER